MEELDLRLLHRQAIGLLQQHLQDKDIRGASDRFITPYRFAGPVLDWDLIAALDLLERIAYQLRPYSSSEVIKVIADLKQCKNAV